MDAVRYVAVILILGFVSESFSRLIIRIKPENQGSAASALISDGRTDHVSYCNSWRFSVETNDAGVWTRIPARCQEYVKAYMTGDQFRSDSELVRDDSLEFAKTVELAGDGRDAWVFDIDETLLSNIPYFANHGFGSETFNESTFDKWVDTAKAPALPASLTFYNELQALGFSVFLLTGRTERQRNVTETNLLSAGYTNWDRLILRRRSDLGKPATVYKSEKRKELEDEGYVIHGSSGDQWSDLVGFAAAKRLFKLPNPMYHIA
ncbi:acid phosphatase 1-like [Diospyros lotus]|uniref:acid phosphatase 1-like n=1 Tax=Diospyros lotus TaxID=55363 RepID=UPI00225A16B1|nr:acid phosphatase 1-like [Diospyros lotus]